ncbi:hypothetical protein F5Y04DRAFT_262734 [Hypomontagnella monticulosa]|nr:hypothetical protein F5Y04DRAFT_262734 [Hypomontagnella monticulosa]
MAWAAEHLLVTLNRPDRQACWYCPLLRNWSNIARGSFEGAMINSRLRFISGDTRHGEMPISWREQNSGQDICEAFAITRQEGCFEPLRWDDPDDTPSAEKNGGEQSTSGSKGAASIEPSKATEPSGGAPKPAESTEPIDPSERKSVPNVAPSSPSKVPLPDSPRKRSKQKPVPPTMASSEGLNSPSNIAQIRTIPRIARPRYSIKQLEALRDGLVDYGNSGLDYERSYKKDPGVFEGVRHIFNTTSTIEIAHLLNTRLGRGWTNFYSYGREEVKTVGGNRTIEFRGAEGTLGPWATTWARICVGLVRFALYAPPAVFGDILTKCEYSTNEDGYDVIDLLNDLGLYTEAAEAEQRFIQNMNEWGLEFVPESDSP